jgi:hypothetical protein
MRSKVISFLHNEMGKKKWCCKIVINYFFMLTVKLMYKLVDREDKAHSLAQIVDTQNIMNKERGMKIKVDNLPSNKFLNIPLA